MLILHKMRNICILTWTIYHSLQISMTIHWGEFISRIAIHISNSLTHLNIFVTFKHQYKPVGLALICIFKKILPLLHIFFRRVYFVTSLNIYVCLINYWVFLLLSPIFKHNNSHHSETKLFECLISVNKIPCRLQCHLLSCISLLNLSEENV